MDVATLVEILTASGILTAGSETVRWWLGRSRTKVDSAKVVQGMALDLLQPLHAELDRATRDMATLRTNITESDRALESVIQWALAARTILDTHGLTYPEVPAVVREP